MPLCCLGDPRGTEARGAVGEGGAPSDTDAEFRLSAMQGAHAGDVRGRPRDSRLAVSCGTTLVVPAGVRPALVVRQSRLQPAVSRRHRYYNC